MILISCQPHKLNKFILINKIFKLKYQILNIEICALRFFFLFPKWRRKLLASAHPLTEHPSTKKKAQTLRCQPPSETQVVTERPLAQKKKNRRYDVKQVHTTSIDTAKNY